MAQEILVKEVLTDRMIDAGKQLLENVGGTKADIVAAFWLYFPEASEWRLVLVSSRVDEDGPRKLYAELAEKLYRENEKVYGLDLRNITFFSPREKLVGALAGANRSYKQSVGHDLSGQRLTDVYLDGVYAEELYLYFMDASVKPSRGSNWYV